MRKVKQGNNLESVTISALAILMILVLFSVIPESYMLPEAYSGLIADQVISQ